MNPKEVAPVIVFFTALKVKNPVKPVNVTIAFPTQITSKLPGRHADHDPLLPSFAIGSGAFKSLLSGLEWSRCGEAQTRDSHFSARKKLASLS
jgi:hypothetical protein